MKLKHFSLALLFTLWPGLVPGADLVGKIQFPEGASSPATVRIYSARMRTGTSVHCPTCWRDCSRSAVTSEEGSFRIEDVSDDLVFDLLVLADGCAPQFIRAVDPDQGPLNGALVARDLSQVAGSHLVRGRVQDADGRPLAGASVEPTWSRPGWDTLTLTNAEGEFVLVGTSPQKGTTRLRIKAAGHTGTFVDLPSGDRTADPQREPVVLRQGVTVSGRVIQKGRPVSGVVLGVVQEDRKAETFLGPWESVTDAEGRFVFHNVSARSRVYLYGVMMSLQKRGALPRRLVETGDHGNFHELGDVPLEEAVTLAGTLVVAHGDPLPAGTRFGLSLESQWDSQQVDVGPEGEFEIAGLPAGAAVHIDVPRHHVVQDVNQGFKVSSSRKQIIGTLSGTPGPLKIVLLRKDEKTQAREELVLRVQSHYAPFFKGSDVSPGVRHRLVAETADFRERMQEIVMRPQPVDLKARGALKAAFQKQLRAWMSPAEYGALEEFECRLDGAPMASYLATAGPPSWLTPEEESQIALAMGRIISRLEAFHAQRPPGDLSEEALVGIITSIREEAVAATLPLLPEAKHSILRAGLEKLFEELQAAEVGEGK